MKRLPKNKVPVCVSMPFDELAEIDDITYSMNLSRSDFILQCVREKIKKLKTK